jgi:hypothetical protein
LIDWFFFPFLCSVYRSQCNNTHHQHTRVDWWWEEGQQKGDFADTTTNLVCAIWYSPVKWENEWGLIRKNNGIGCAEIRVRSQSEPAPTSAPAGPFALGIVAGESAQVTLNSWGMWGIYDPFVASKVAKAWVSMASYRLSRVVGKSAQVIMNSWCVPGPPTPLI